MHSINTEFHKSYYNNQSVGRKHLSYFIDGSLIKDIVESYGSCAEALTKPDKLHLIGAIAEELFRLCKEELALNADVVYKTLVHDIPLDSYQQLLEIFSADCGQPVRYHLDGFQSINFLCEQWGECLEDVENKEHYFLLWKLAYSACNRLLRESTEAIGIPSEHVEEIISRLDELGSPSDSIYLIQALLANLN